MLEIVLGYLPPSSAPVETMKRNHANELPHIVELPQCMTSSSRILSATLVSTLAMEKMSNRHLSQPVTGVAKSILPAFDLP